MPGDLERADELDEVDCGDGVDGVDCRDGVDEVDCGDGLTVGVDEADCADVGGAKLVRNACRDVGISLPRNRLPESWTSCLLAWPWTCGTSNERPSLNRLRDMRRLRDEAPRGIVAETQRKGKSRRIPTAV